MQPARGDVHNNSHDEKTVAGHVRGVVRPETLGVEGGDKQRTYRFRRLGARAVGGTTTGSWHLRWEVIDVFRKSEARRESASPLR